jgi:predicted homoserine dehydrogenase-like protein
MSSLAHRLRELVCPIRTAIIGTGSIGTGIAYQCGITPGFHPSAIADIDFVKAEQCARLLNVPYTIVETKSQLAAALDGGVLAVSRDALLLAASDRFDILIEASNAVYDGALHARAALRHGQHVVMMNYEAELMYGPLLLQEARTNSRVYTCADGDQPTAIKQLVDDIELWNLEPVMLGNIKGFHDRYTDPAKIAPEADKRRLDHIMCSAYTDGSKLNVEMAVLANGVGARILRPGMTGPRMASIHDIFRHFDFEKIWRSGEPPIVDYVLGAQPKGGVFVIGYTADAYQQFTLSWFPPDVGPGPFYLFYRPFHLGHIEALRCAAEAFLDQSARLAPVFGMRMNVFCYAKRDLRAGEILDGMGGYLTCGLIESVDDAAADCPDGMPQLISNGARLLRDIRKNERIALKDCDLGSCAQAFGLYREACGLTFSHQN